MVARLGLILLFLFLGTAIGAAKPKRKGKKAKPVVTEQQEETGEKPAREEARAAEKTAPGVAEKIPAVPETDTAKNPADEMEVYRVIQQRKLSTVQDMVDALLMYRGEFGKFPSPQSRIERARELKILKSSKGDDKLERGTFAYAIMKTYHPESGWLFWITGWERFAIRDVQQADLMPTKSTGGQYMTGEQMLGTITTAEEFVAKRNNHASNK